MTTRYINGRPVQVKNSTYARVCPHNEGILCEKTTCWKCGWNPEVDKERRKRNG